MKTSNGKLILVMLCASLAFASCKKEGCTDKSALNFDSKAKKDDGACRFSEVVFNVDPGDLMGSTLTTTVKLNGAIVGTVQNTGSTRTTLQNGNTNNWSATGTMVIQGETYTFSNSGTVAANSSQPIVNVEVW